MSQEAWGSGGEDLKILVNCTNSYIVYHSGHYIVYLFFFFKIHINLYHFLSYTQKYPYPSWKFHSERTSASRSKISAWCKAVSTSRLDQELKRWGSCSSPTHSAVMAQETLVYLYSLHRWMHQLCWLGKPSLHWGQPLFCPKARLPLWTPFLYPAVCLSSPLECLMVISGLAKPELTFWFHLPDLLSWASTITS